MSFDHVMATACARTITLLYIYFYVWGLDFRLNNINYFCWYFSSSVNHHILILNPWNTIQPQYHNQWVSYLWYIDCFVNCLNNRSVIWINVWDWCSYVVLNTGIRYNNGRRRVWQYSKCNIIQVFNVFFDIWRMQMERKSIWKRINKMISWNEFLVENWKGGKKVHYNCYPHRWV